MDNNNIALKKLQDLIEKRKEDLVSVRQFDDLFFKAMRFDLREAVHKVTLLLEKNTDDSLKIFYDDPYEFSLVQHFTMVQLFIGSNKGSFLDNTQRNPSIKFEGQEFSAKVKIFIKLQNQDKYKEIREVNVQKLTHDYLLTTIVDFIEQVYNK